MTNNNDKNINNNLPFNIPVNYYYPYQPHPYLMQYPPIYYNNPYSNFPFNYNNFNGNNINNNENIVNNSLKKEEINKTTIKSKDYYINNFLENILPKLRMSRLIKLQALIRGSYIRKIIIPRKKVWANTYIILTKSFIDNKIESKFINEIILDCINEIKINNDPNYYSPELKGVITYTNDLIDKSVKQLSREIVNQVISQLTTDYMSKKNKNIKEDSCPFTIIVNKIFENYIKIKSENIVKQSINDISNECLFEAEFNKYYTAQLFNPLLTSLVLESIDEVIIENIIDAKINYFLSELSEPLSLLVLEEEYFDKEESDLKYYFNKYINREFMDTALNYINEIISENNLEYIADLAVNFGRFKEINIELIDDIRMED